MVLKPEELARRARYKFVIGAIQPRPIAWVSSRDAAGRLNLAPYSFFTGACSDPMTVIFCPQVTADGRDKDTLNNVRAVGEFVVNFTNEDTAAAMNQTATLLPAGESEFDYAGLTPAASTTISVPRVAEAPIAFECVLQQIVTINPEPGGGHAVFGTVTCIHIRDDVYDNGYVVREAYRPIGRLAGDEYTRVSDVFTLVRDRQQR